MPPELPEIIPGDTMPETTVNEHLQSGRVFAEVRHLAFGAVTASMVAYMAAQFCDVHLYHFGNGSRKGAFVVEKQCIHDGQSVGRHICGDFDYALLCRCIEHQC